MEEFVYFNFFCQTQRQGLAKNKLISRDKKGINYYFSFIWVNRILTDREENKKVLIYGFNCKNYFKNLQPNFVLREINDQN